MSIHMHEYVLERLEETKGNWSQVSEESGVNKRTLEKIARQEIRDPGVSIIQALFDYFSARERKRKRVA